MSTRLPLFAAYGVELEYMIVNRDSLAVMPIADELLKHELGEFGSDFENGRITWSNELVLHVIELKCTQPERDLITLEKEFVKNIARINTILAKWNAMLLPTAAHPLMNPKNEMKLWPHDNNEVYAIYNKIFDCRGHGWSNLQSTHLNLPFANDEEFGKLHAAIRLVLPLLPALCASSPILDGLLSGYHDTRLTFYKTNQAQIPSITGSIIPEPVYTEKDHTDVILKQIEKDIAPYNHNSVLDPVWVNSRGAMSRFDRGSIEIRIMDIQECPAADMAIASLVIETLKALVNEDFASYEDQKKMNTASLANILEDTIKTGQLSLINDRDYLTCWHLINPLTAKEIWKSILKHLLRVNERSLAPWKNSVSILLNEGTLSDRILRAVGPDPTPSTLKKVYRELSVCFAENRMFLP